MLRKTFFAALALGLSALPASAQAYGQPPVIVVPRPAAYALEIRLLNWQERIFATKFDADDYAAKHVRHGYEVLLASPGPQEHRVKYRALNWVLSRYAGSADEAAFESEKLRRRGFEVRIVRL